MGCWVKGFDSMLTRALVAARAMLVRISTELPNQIRGFMETFGPLVPAGKGSTFEKNVRNLPWRSPASARSPRLRSSSP